MLPRLIEADQYYNGNAGYYLSDSVSTIEPQLPHLYHYPPVTTANADIVTMTEWSITAGCSI